MSQVYTCPGPVAISSGRARAGWRASRRRSLTCALLGQDPIHAWRPNTDRRPRRAASRRPASGCGRRTRSLLSTPSTSARSAAVSRFAGAGAGERRHRERGSRSAAVRRAVAVERDSPVRLGRVPGRDPGLGQRPVGVHQRLLDGGSSAAALSEISSKSACAFPMMSNAVSVVGQPSLGLVQLPRSRAISACSAVSRPTFSPGRLPSSTPASRSLRHSVICEEYRPSRRRYAPPSPCSARLAHRQPDAATSPLGERAPPPTDRRPWGGAVSIASSMAPRKRGTRSWYSIRISPCVRRTCSEPLASTHPDTQGPAG